MPRTYPLGMVGESKTNADGTERQTIIAKMRPGESELLISRPSGSSSSASGGSGRSSDSKDVGDQAEADVFLWLQQNLPSSQAETLAWPAKDGERPGWDIQYEPDEGGLIAVEVKGTTLSRFASVELTRNE